MRHRTRPEPAGFLQSTPLPFRFIRECHAPFVMVVVRTQVCHCPTASREDLRRKDSADYCEPRSAELDGESKGAPEAVFALAAAAWRSCSCSYASWLLCCFSASKLM